MGRDLLKRTFNFSSRAFKFCMSLNSDSEIGIMRKQLVRAATSVGANYRASRRARSRKDFISRLGVVEEEADECIYWLSMLEEAGIVSKEAAWLKKEADEIAAIMVASRKTARSKLNQ